MNKISRSFIKFSCWILTGLLSLLGCSSDDDEVFEMTAMYGTPRAEYTVKGKVTNQKTGKPIKGLEVKVEFPDSLKNEINQYPQEQVTRTNSKGKFELKDSFYPSWLIVTDIDGDINGKFDADTTLLDFSNAEFTKKGDKYYLTKTVDIELNEK